MGLDELLTQSEYNLVMEDLWVYRLRLVLYFIGNKSVSLS